MIYEEHELAAAAQRATVDVIADRLDAADAILADCEDDTVGYARETLAALRGGDLVRAAVAVDKPWSSWVRAYVPLRRALADALVARAGAGDWAHRMLGVWAVGLSVDQDADFDTDMEAMLARRVAWADARRIQFDGDAMPFVLARLFLAHGFVPQAAYWGLDLAMSAPGVFDEVAAAAATQLAAGVDDWSLHAIAIRRAIRDGVDPSAAIAAARVHDPDDNLVSSEIRTSREACAVPPPLAALDADIPAPLGMFEVTAGVLSVGDPAHLAGHEIVVDALPGTWIATRAGRWLVAHHTDHGAIVSTPRWFEVGDVDVAQRAGILDAATLRGHAVDVRGSLACRAARDCGVVGVALALAP